MAPVQKTSSEKISSVKRSNFLTVGKVRYLIHRAYRVKKISLDEWRKYLEYNLEYSHQERLDLVKYLDSLPAGRILTRQFRKQEFIKTMRREILKSILSVLFLVTMWAIAYLSKGFNYDIILSLFSNR